MAEQPQSIETQNTVLDASSELGAAFGRGPATDKNRAFELAELERRLFGTDTVEPFRVGRFTVMEKLGSGGMGVVYAAFDPQLERKIAVKFLRSELQGGDSKAEARLFREAQALAKLGHPNVVSVFDVGTYEGGVYVAMEFVNGASLSQWAQKQKPSWREILDAYLQAGQGLAAAHRAGVVHRDFKPDNALRGEDGRVRVLDFGLAAPTDAELAKARDDSKSDPGDAPDNADTGAFSDPLTRTGAVMGTPLYMAPEQHLGERADARCDQFAFCVSLWVTLFGERPFPGDTMAALSTAVTQGQLRPMPRSPRLPPRVRAAIIKGLQVDPEKRFATIDELLTELDVGARRRRTLMVASSALGFAAAIGGGLAWQLRGETEPSPCARVEERIEQVWNEAKSMDAAARFAKTDAEKTWAELAAAVDDHAQQWRQTHERVCSEPEVDLEQLSCLDWRLQELDTLAGILAKAEPDKLHLIAQGAAALDPPAACSDPKALSLMLPPARDPARRETIHKLRTELARAKILHKAGQHDAALEVARTTVASAREIDEAAVEAESLVLLGGVLAEGGQKEEAETTLRKAVHRAEAAGHDEARARGLGLLIGIVGFRKGESTEELEDRFEAVRQRFGDLPSRALVDYLLGVTMVRIGHGRIRDATLAAREALEETQRLGLDATKAHTQLGLALTLLGRYDEARVELDTALEDIDMQHPDAVLVLGVTGIHRGFVGEDREAIESFERALALEGERKLGQPHYRALVGTYMAISVDRLGNAEKAIFMQRTAIAALKQLWGEEHGALGRAYHQFGTTLADNGKWPEARDAFERSLSIWKRTHGSNHRAVAHPETGLARVLLHEGRHVEALRLLESALPKLAAEDGHPAEDSRTYFHLARALALTDGDQTRARQLAATALELLAALGPGYDRDRQVIKTWQAEHSTQHATP